MNIKRRDFLRYCITSAAALGLPLGVVDRLSKAYAAGGADLPKVIWLNAANCSGCTVSLANLIDGSGQGPADVADLLVNAIDLMFHPVLMGAAGDSAVQSLKTAAAGNFILVVEGGIPTAFGGHACMLWSEGGQEITAQEAVLTLAAKAQAVLSVGTCSSFGGIPAGGANNTGIKSVGELTGRPVINIPGCPTHPDWIVSVVALLLAGVSPRLDQSGRPLTLFPGEAGLIHKNCPYKETDEVSTFATPGCLKALGCKGPVTQADCFKRKWNNGTQWCIGANALCIGCTEKGFPDQFLPFYKTRFTTPVNILEISLAQWRVDTAELVVEGRGTAGSTVRLMAADTNSFLADVPVDAAGLWRFAQVIPSFVPRQVQAEGGGLTAAQNVVVIGTPSTPPPATGSLTITKAEWRTSRKELQVEGKADKGQVVKVYNAASGALLGATNADSRGIWRTRLRNPSPVPTRVQAKAGTQAVELAVTSV